MKKKSFKVVWTDTDEQCISHVKAYDIKHAEELFWEGIMDWQGDCRGIMILEITKVKTKVK
jgi:hypothetical protein